MCASGLCEGFSLSLFPTVLVITVSVVIVEVTFPTVIPVVIMFNAATASVPIPTVIPFAVVVRRDPTSALIRWPGPIAFVPSIMSSHGIPITPHPHASRIWHRRGNHSNRRRRWRANNDTNGDLCSAHSNSD